MQYPEPQLPRVTDEHALISIASRSQLPPRVRALLEGMLALSGGVLERVLTQTLNDLEQQLFKDAERARNATEQHDVFGALREVKRGRADVTPRLMQHLESSLARLDEANPSRGLQAPPTRKAGELALVDTRDLEEQITLQEVAAKGEIRHSQALYALGHRFGVLAGAPLFDAESLPLGPHHLCEALRHAVAGLGLRLEDRQTLYRLFDRHITPELGVLYAALNDYLIEKRVLRSLTVVLRKAAPRHPGGVADAAPAHAAEANEAPAPPTPAARGDGAARERPASAYAFGAQPRPGLRDAATPRPAEPAPSPALEAELFATLRELLAGRRSSLPAPPAPANVSNYVASGDDLQAVLGALQTRPAAPMMLGGRLVQRSVAHVKQDLMAQLRQFTPDGRSARLTDEDGDTIDLVGMLFDHIVKDTRPNGASQSLLTKLQVPVLRVALRDKSFFTRRTHPARQLLNAMAETGTYWADDEGDTDRALVEKMQLVVDRVSNEYDGRPELFEELLGDLSRHMGTLARKAEVAERRHVDAAKGRERLDVAREHAAKAIGERLSQGRPNRLVRALLEQAWTDVLALTILRQGENTEIYRRRLAVADTLIAGRDEAGVREEMEQGLSQVGFLPEEIQTMVRQIVAPTDLPTPENPSSRTEMAMRLKSKTRLGEDGADPGHGPRRALQPPLTAEEGATLERLRTLPFGTWFEFVTNQQGECVRRKLSWFSTLTGRCLFVNQRGARADERTLEQLARDVTRGQIRLAQAERESVIDRAWNAILGTLRQFSGQTAAQGAAS